MPTLEENVASLVAATTALTSTVNVRKSTLDAAVTTAQNSATAAAGSLNAVSQINAVANAAATLCAASAQQAATARDQALSAVATATAPLETLAGVSQLTHVGNVVRTLIADTSRDSDGGAWRKKCAALSYTQEQLTGRWLGVQYSEQAARLHEANTGAELFPKPELENATGLSLGAGWSIANGLAVATGATGGLGDASNYAAYVPGKRYKVAVRINAASAGYVQVYLRGGAVSVAANVNAPGTYVFDAVAGSSTTEGLAVLGINFTGSVDLVSVKEVLSTNRVGTVNYAPSSNDLTTAQWNATNASRSASSVTYSGRAFTLLTENTGNANHGLVSQSWSSLLNLKTVALSIPVKPNGRTKFHVWIDNGSGVGVTVGFDTVALTAAFTRQNSGFSGVGLPKIVDVGGGIFMCSFVAKNTAAPAGQWGQIRVFLDNGSGVSDTFGSFTYAGDGVSGMHIGAPQLEIGGEVSSIYVPTVGNSPACAPGGDYYQNAADGKYYCIGALGGQAEVFRGNKAEFPAIPDFKSESGRFVIYDLTQPGCPMWMVFAAAGGNHNVHATVLSCLGYRDGVVYMGNAVSGGALLMFDFIQDRTTWIHTGGVRIMNGTISQRNANLSWRVLSLSPSLLSNYVNDCAVTVLTDAPVDLATGLPASTIATAGGTGNAGGVGTVISHSGVPVFYSQAGVDGTQVSFLPNGDVVWGLSSGSGVYAMPLATSNVGSLSAGGARIYGVGTTPGFSSGPFNRKSVSAGAMLACYGTQAGNGFHFIKENPSTQALGMVATITKDYNTGWCFGDNRLALADTVAETISGGELGTNSAVITSATGWAGANGASVAYAAGEITATNTTATYGRFVTPTFSAVAGKTYAVKVTVSGSSQRACNGVSLFDGFNNASGNSPPIAIGQSLTFNLTATASGNLSVRGEIASLVIGESATVSSISIKQVEADRSPKNIGLLPIGPLQKTQVALAAQLVAYGALSIAGDGTFTSGALAYTGNAFSGFFGSDFVIQSWMEGDADFYINSASPVGFPWTATAGDGHTLSRSGAPGTKGVVLAKVVAGVRTGLSSGIATPTASGWNLWTIVRRSGVLSVWLCDQLIGSQTLAAGSATDLGFYFGVTGRFALFRASATAPSADDIAKTYRDELPRFQPGAQDTLAGASNAVSSVAYDPVTDATHALTGWGRSSFKGLVRYDSEATAVGTPSCISALGGVVSTAGSTGARIYMPALSLREELKRKDEARAALGRVPWVISFDAIAGQTVFPLPKGTRPLAVYLEGALKRVGATKWYTVLDDGYQESVKAAVAPGAAAQVDVLVVRK